MGADAVAVLSGACSAVRPGEPADAVGGNVPAAVAAPATVAEASELLRAASRLGLAMLPRGTATKLNWGVPPTRCDLVVDTTRLSAITEHAAGDLVVRVQAGLTMAELAAQLGSAGQQLALDTPGTVGGVVATGAAGPRRLRYGGPRDLLIGITVVLADGTVASSGGKVVKNVAGYDLGKLFAGSYGTLGLIAETAFRLHPLPQESVYVTLTCATAADAADRIATAIESRLVPSAAEIDRPAPAAALSVGLLLEGAADAVAERVNRMRDILGGQAHADTVPPAWWGRSVAGSGGVVLRIAFPPGALATVLGAVDEAADGRASGGPALHPQVCGSAGAGVLDVGLPGDTEPDAARSFLAALRHRLVAPASFGDVAGASVTVVRGAPGMDALARWGPVPALGLMRAVKDRFDPGHLLSPGRFAGGI